MKSKRMYRILALVVVLSMILTTAAFAVPGNKNDERDTKKAELKDEDYNLALLSLIEKEIVKGYGKGDYGLSGNVKRGDVIVMIIRALDLDDEYNAKELGENYLNLLADEEDFEDNKDKDAYYYGPIKVAKKLGIAKGDGRYFKPNKPVTIQEAIWLIERAEDLLEDDDVLDSGRIEDLTETYYTGDQLNEFAKRRDVIWMLNYVIEGIEDQENEDDDDKKTELNDIELDIDEDETFLLKDDWFEEVLDDADVKDFNYIKFNRVTNGKLFYDYDAEEEDNDLISRSTEYYLGTAGEDRIDKITLVPNKDFVGTITVKYTAFDDDGETYIGYIVITVEADNDIATLTLNDYLDNEYIRIKFVDKLEKLVDEDLFDSLEYVEFSTPDKGTLQIKLEDEPLEEVDKDDNYELNDIEYIKYKFDGEGKVELNYSVYDDDDTSYDGKIVLNIED